MLTLEVHGQFITWPEEFALLMMKHYRKHGVTVILHRHCTHSGWDTLAKNKSTAVITGTCGVFECSC